jgi:putative heme-binding domain-containing protein
LTRIGSRRNAAYLRRTILKPADSLPEGFAYYAATDEAGRTVRGIRVNEDTFTIQVKDAGGRFHSFRKSELKDLRRLEHETPMPAYEGKLAGAELDDLIAYLAALRGKS